MTMSQNQGHTKNTLFPQIFKVLQNKVSLFLHFMLSELRYGHFMIWTCFFIKWPYLGKEAEKQKNKGTLLFQILRVQEKRVPLFGYLRCLFSGILLFIEKHAQGTKL